MKINPDTRGDAERKGITDEATNKVSGGVLKFTFADWTCKSCGADNKPADSKCAGCGADRESGRLAHIPR